MQLSHSYDNKMKTRPGYEFPLNVKSDLHYKLLGSSSALATICSASSALSETKSPLDFTGYCSALTLTSEHLTDEGK